MAGLTYEKILARLEASGAMDERREQPRKWFGDHPYGTPGQAVAAHPEWTLPDHMYAVADSVQMDLRAAVASKRAGLAVNPASGWPTLACRRLRPGWIRIGAHRCAR